MRYVGYSEFYHDAALAIIEEDGTVSYASHAERYTKKKNDSHIPDEMWDLVKKDDHLTFYEDLSTKFDVRGDENKMEYSVVCDQKHMHHESHCASAFYTRPWESTEDTVMVSIDGVGELQTACIYDHKFNLLKQFHYPKSIGLTYSLVTEELGLRPLEDEYVVMGLSSYGKDVFSDFIIDWFYKTSDIAREVEEGKRVDSSSARALSRHRFTQKLKQLIHENTPEDAAASVQKFAEHEILEFMKVARGYGSKLVYSGGVAQNVVANSMIYDMFDDMHISIAPTDAGSALGCAAKTWAEQTGGTHLKWNPYLGHDIQREINPREVVDHILKHKVCGVANGRAEFGPRALGNRSLIADVRYDVKDTVNEIKRRQKYRPFAPAVLAEHANEYFSGPMNEYMQYTSKALHDYSSVTHVDGTARVQLLQPDCPSIFRKIVEEYYERTGVPMLLNTSLNIRGRPIVNDELDARLWENKYKVKVF